LVFFPRGPRSTSSITSFLVIANVAVYILTSFGGHDYLLLLAQSGDYFFSGAYWQVFTAMFVHFDITHILFNMFALVYFGLIDEGTYSRKEFVAIYFSAGLIGNVASLFLIPPDTLTGGASGAIFGLIGAYVATERKGTNLLIACVYAALIFLDSAGPGVNIFAHLFGVGTGFVMGFIFSERIRKREIG
jgi:rhomboid protease GluP